MRDYAYPIGFRPFNPSVVMNFQLNRWHSMGVLPGPELERIGAAIRNFGDWKREMRAAAERAESEVERVGADERASVLEKAAYYWRAAEFFTYPGDPDKAFFYGRFLELFESAHRGEEYERLEADFEGSRLPVMRIRAIGKRRDTLVIHGGFDSFIEEFYPIAVFAARRGFEVVLFEGPGQGRALHEGGLKMIHDWERPTSAVLDALGLDDISLIGVSLGGYLCLRAAAYEKRITRVIAFDLIWDFFSGMNPPTFAGRVLLPLLIGLGARKALASIEAKARAKSDFADWYLSHGRYIFGAADLLDYYRAARRMNARAASALVDQDVLVMAGEEDVWTKYLEPQMAALSHARSSTSRLFTKAEDASHHCQVGNLPLAMDFILDWIGAHPPLTLSRSTDTLRPRL